MASLAEDAARAAAVEKVRPARPYANPYLAGIGLGLVLLSAFVLVGRGLGASGAFNALAAWLASLVAPAYARSNEFLSGYLAGETHPLKTWLVFEMAGLFAGAFLSGLLARRLAGGIERGPRASIAMRLVLAFAGGMLMGFGSALARGCASGQALTGGALLNLGSWAFMICFFAGAYLAAPLLRREWR